MAVTTDDPVMEYTTPLQRQDLVKTSTSVSLLLDMARIMTA